MKQKPKQFQLCMLLFLILHGGLVAFAQTNTLSSQMIQNAIIPQALTHVTLFEETNINVDGISTFYIQDHGVEFNFSSDLKINDKPVVLIQKSDLGALKGAPYFLFHTLNIEASKALVRVYMSYELNGERKSNNVELFFAKNNNHWEIDNSQP